MATITIASTVLPNYHYQGTTHTIRVFSDKSWVALDGTIVPARGNDSTFYKEYTLTVVEPNATIPIVTLLSQTDAPIERNAKYLLYHYVDGIEKDMVLANTVGAFTLPATPASTTWAAVEAYNSQRNRRSWQDSNTYSRAEINALIAAVGTAGFTSAGVATMTAGTVTVSLSTVTINSQIVAVSQDDGISGTLRVPITGITPSTSFVISSTNGADNGSLVWLLREP